MRVNTEEKGWRANAKWGENLGTSERMGRGLRREQLQQERRKGPLRDTAAAAVGRWRRQSCHYRSMVVCSTTTGGAKRLLSLTRESESERMGKEVEKAEEQEGGRKLRRAQQPLAC